MGTYGGDWYTFLEIVGKIAKKKLKSYKKNLTIAKNEKLQKKLKNCKKRKIAKKKTEKLQKKYNKK